MIELEEMTPDVPRGAVNWDTLEQIEEDPIEWQQYDAAREAAEPAVRKGESVGIYYPAAAPKTGGNGCGKECV